MAEAQDASRIYTVIENYSCEAIYLHKRVCKLRFQKLEKRGDTEGPIRQTCLWNHVFQICLWKSSQCDLLANAVKPVETLAVSESSFSLVVILLSPTKFKCSLEAQLQGGENPSAWWENQKQEFFQGQPYQQIHGDLSEDIHPEVFKLPFCTSP